MKLLFIAGSKDEESKILAYNQANRAVALLCNHQRMPPKNYNQQVVRMKQRVSYFSWMLWTDACCVV